MCVQPIEGWLSYERNANGKRPVVFDRGSADADRPIAVPCGKCVECRNRKARDWAVRIMHESQLHDEKWFVTLTYDDRQLPDGGQLCKRDVQLFLKRLRKDGHVLRYFGVGEYGSVTGRPHYHLCLFGVGFPDKRHHTTRKGYQVYTSAYLDRRWQKGICEFGSLSYESAAYVARYLTKGTVVADSDTRVGEFAVMSRKPGIGKDWWNQFRCEVYAADSVVVRGKELRPPVAYDRWQEAVDPDGLRRVKRRRLQAVDGEEERGERWRARKEVGEARVNLFRREPE